MVSALRPQRRQTPAPTKVDDGPALVEDFIWDTDGTRYRVLVVSLGPDVLVLAEPAGKWPSRCYMPLTDNRSDLSEEYVAEKLGLEYPSADSHNLTLLIGFALQRAVLLSKGGYYERREPA